VPQFLDEQLLQAPELLPWLELPEARALPLPTEKPESIFLTLRDEQRGQRARSEEVADATTSNVFLHLAHSYSNIGKVITPIALPITS
jgi:hypothetical protein